MSNREGGLVISHSSLPMIQCFSWTQTKENATAPKDLLIWFEAVFGLRINLRKSRLFKVGEVDRFEELAEVLGVVLEYFPCTCMGMPLGARSLSFPIWEKVLEKLATSLGCGKLSACP